jgi:hypothetical protein
VNLKVEDGEYDVDDDINNMWEHRDDTPSGCFQAWLDGGPWHSSSTASRKSQDVCQGTFHLGRRIEL